MYDSPGACECHSTNLSSLIFLVRPFAYQSGSECSGLPGSFEGHMTFTWGTKDHPSGPRFDVKLEKFTLGIPDYIY